MVLVQVPDQLYHQKKTTFMTAKVTIQRGLSSIQNNGFLSLFRRSRGRDINASCGSLANKKSVGNE